MPGTGRTLLFLALALLAETAGTVGGFGSSVFFVPLANFFLPLTTVLGLVALFHLASNLAKLGLFRAGIDRALMLRLGVPSVLFAAAGAWAGAFLAPRWLEVVLALFLVASSAALLLRPQWGLVPSTRNAMLGGAVSGWMAGMVGTGGAVRGLSLAAFGLPKEVFVATSAAIDLGVDSARALVYWRNGYMREVELAWVPWLVLVDHRDLARPDAVAPDPAAALPADRADAGAGDRAGDPGGRRAWLNGALALLARAPAFA